MERIAEMMKSLQKKDKPLSTTLCAMVVTPLVMVIINRALRHTSYLSVSNIIYIICLCVQLNMLKAMLIKTKEEF